ncbi:MAG: thioesterase family protein [Chloroflexota bacterium]
MVAARIGPGLSGELSWEITEERTARHIGSGSLRVFATPAMVLLIERACVQLLQPLLPEGQSTVGVGIQLRHLAPTPLGMTVRARVEVTAVEDGRISLRAEVWDERERVGEAEHQRAIVDVERFLRRVQAKAEAGSN